MHAKTIRYYCARGRVRRGLCRRRGRCPECRACRFAIPVFERHAGSGNQWRNRRRSYGDAGVSLAIGFFIAAIEPGLDGVVGPFTRFARTNGNPHSVTPVPRAVSVIKAVRTRLAE